MRRLQAECLADCRFALRPAILAAVSVLALFARVVDPIRALNCQGRPSIASDELGGLGSAQYARGYHQQVPHTSTQLGVDRARL